MTRSGDAGADTVKALERLAKRFEKILEGFREVVDDLEEERMLADRDDA